MVIPKGQVLSHPGLQRRRTFKSASRTISNPGHSGTSTIDSGSTLHSQALALQQGILVDNTSKRKSIRSLTNSGFKIFTKHVSLDLPRYHPPLFSKNSSASLPISPETLTSGYFSDSESENL